MSLKFNKMNIKIITLIPLWHNTCLIFASVGGISSATGIPRLCPNTFFPVMTQPSRPV